MFRSDLCVLSIGAAEVGEAENYTSPTSAAPIDRMLRSDLNIPDHFEGPSKAYDPIVHVSSRFFRQVLRTSRESLQTHGSRRLLAVTTFGDPEAPSSPSRVRVRA